MHDFDLKNRYAIITGGAQGFGLDIATRFIKSGSKVRIWDIDETELQKASKEINSDKLSYDVVDVSSFTQVKNKVDQIAANSKIDILVNSAGITGPTTELWNYKIEDWSKIMEINLNGIFYCCKVVVPHMIKNNYGRIVNIASVSAKAGVIGLTKSLGKELALNNIAVNAVTPAGANTRILNQMSKEHVQRMLSKVPKGRFLEVHELTSMVCWLSSEENSFSTAAVFDISGGRSTY